MSRRNRNTPEETPAPAAPATLADESLEREAAEISRDVAGQPAIDIDAEMPHPPTFESRVVTGDGGHGTAELKPGLPIEEGYPDRDPRTLGDIGGPGITHVPNADVEIVLELSGAGSTAELAAFLQTGEGLDRLVDKLCAYRARKFGPRAEVAAWRPADEVDPCRALVEEMYAEVKDQIGGPGELLAARLARVLDVHHPARC